METTFWQILKIVTNTICATKVNYSAAMKDCTKFDILKVTTVYKSVLAVFTGIKAIAIGQKTQLVILMGPQRKKKRHFQALQLLHQRFRPVLKCLTQLVLETTRWFVTLQIGLGTGK